LELLRISATIEELRVRKIGQKWFTTWFFPRFNLL